MDYRDMSLEELWKEITILVNCTHFSEVDKQEFINLLNIWKDKEDG